MKVTIFEQPNLSEDYAEIHCVKETPEIEMIIDYIKSGITQIQGRSDDSEKMLFLNEIYYFESVDKKVFAYLKDTAWEVEFSLKELEEQFKKYGFVRINKSVVANLYKIDLIKKDFEMRMLIQSVPYFIGALLYNKRLKDEIKKQNEDLQFIKRQKELT